MAEDRTPRTVWPGEPAEESTGSETPSDRRRSHRRRRGEPVVTPARSRRIDEEHDDRITRRPGNRVI